MTTRDNYIWNHICFSFLSTTLGDFHSRHHLKDSILALRPYLIHIWPSDELIANKVNNLAELCRGHTAETEVKSINI